MTRRSTVRRLAFMMALVWLANPATAGAPCAGRYDFADVPAGPFISGSDAAEREYGYRISAMAAAASDAPTDVAKEETWLRADRWFDNEPERGTVDLPAFCIAKLAVTNAEYADFIRDTGHREPSITAAEYQAQGFLFHPYAKVETYLWRDGTYPAGQGQHSVVLVDHADARAYAAWKSRRDGQTYRLPTALEWEKAARGTDGRYYPWGDTWRNDGGNWSRDGQGNLAPAGSFPAGRSIYGVLDTAGNLFEFTADVAPQAGGTGVVMKGCGYDDLPGFCRAAFRHTRTALSRHILIGFRLVLD
jgi:toxoflavin biosynthesis protein ToxD